MDMTHKNSFRKIHFLGVLDGNSNLRKISSIPQTISSLKLSSINKYFIRKNDKTSHALRLPSYLLDIYLFIYFFSMLQWCFAENLTGKYS